jgi:hypothetical protein
MTNGHSDDSRDKTACSIPASALQVCFKDLKKCWKQCIDAGGSYFKKTIITRA